MAKKVTKVLKLQIPGGKAVPGQALGPALGSAGFNDETKDRVGETVPTVIEVFDDRTYKMTYKTEPASQMILKAMGQENGSGKPNTVKIGSITKAQVKTIAEKKMPDLSAASVEAAMRTIEGTARNMGVEVK